MEYEMQYKALNTNTSTDEQLQGYINLNLAIILRAVIDGDKEWLLGPQFNRIMLCLPDKILQREMGIGLIDMTPKQVANQLIKRIDRGDFKGRVMINTNSTRGPAK